MRLAKWVLSGVTGILLVFGVSMAAQTARAPQEPDVLGSLLVEVRGLRQAMERVASAGPQVQLALGRLQLQEQRINTMIRRLESVRDSVAAAEKAHIDVQSELGRMEHAAKGASVPEPEREAIANMLGALKRRAAASAADVQRLQGEAAQLEQQIATEQARWADINRTLEELERVLGKR